MGAIEAGMCNTVAIFRSMNGYTEVRIGGTGARAAAPVAATCARAAYGWQSAGQMFAPTFMRHMYDYGTTSAQVAHVKVAHSKHASNNPKACYKKRVTVEDVLNSRIICKPLHCWTAAWRRTTPRASSSPRPSAPISSSRPVYIRRGGRVCKPRIDFH